MKKISALFLAVFMLVTVLPAVPTTVFAAADTSFINATFEADDTTTWTTVNTATISKASGGANGSGNALKTHIEKGAWSSIQDLGAASFAFTPVIGKAYTLSADVKLTTCSATVPTSVSFVLKTAGGTETVLAATTDKALSKTDWAHCTATFTPTVQIASIEVRIGSGKITEIGEKKTTSYIFTTYTFEFLMDNLLALPELDGSDALSMDFEEGWYPSYGKVSDNTNITWYDADTIHNSKGAIHFSTKKDYGGVRFPLRAAVGNTYEISVWIKPDKTPANQNATFVIYSPVKEKPWEGAWNQFTAHHEENFEAGKWTLCTATFTPDGQGTYQPGGVTTRADVLEESDIEFRLGGGIVSQVMGDEIAFMMDDFFVFPEGDNKGDSKERITGGDLSTQATLTDNWYSYSGNAKSTWQAEGANGTAGSAHVEVTSDWGRLQTLHRVDMEFGRTYTMTFWAKATSDAAVGLEMYAYLSYDGKALEETPSWVITKPSQGPRTLTTAWQKFTIDFAPSSTTSEKIYPYLNFRVGAGTEKISYAVDEISVVQKGDSNFDIDASCMRTSNGKNIVLQMNFTGSTSNYFVYRMIRETASGNEVVKTAKTTDSYVFLDETEYDDLSSVYFEVIGVDAYNLCSRKKTCRLSDLVPADHIKLSTDQYIWTKDVPEVSATVVYDNQTKGRTLRLIGAQYSVNNELLCSDEVAKTVSVGDKQEWNVSIPAHKDAVRAKFFAWFGDNFGPATPETEIYKTTSGEFIYVDVNSRATSEDGSFANPYKSLDAARTKLKDRIAQSTEKDIYVILKGGEYVPGSYATMDITAQEYAEDKQVIYTSLDSDRAKITGAKHLTGFERIDSNKNIYRASVPAGTQTRQLYVNGVKATRARSAEDAVPFVNLDQGAQKDAFSNLGLTSTDTSFLDYQYPNELEMYFTQKWKHQFVHVDTITKTSDGLAHFGFTDNAEKWKGLATDSNTPAQLPVYVENAYELLDEPGEWYLDTHKNYIYYIPREFENMTTADVVIPGMERLLSIQGTANAHAKNMTFKNIDFEYATWNYPTANRGFINGQNATYDRPDSDGVLMDAAIELFNARNITFDNCDFSKIGSMALKMTGAIQYCNVIGNEFYEVAGSAISLGEVEPYLSLNGVNLPTEDQCITDNVIANNYIHKIATEYKGASAIGAGFPKNTVIRNNDISDGPYSGIHTGWGWGYGYNAATQNLVIEKNYIHDFLNWRLYDGAGIYTLGRTNGTKENPNYLRGNYIVDIQNHHSAIYPDEGSSGWNISDNVCDMHNYPEYYGDGSYSGKAMWLNIWTTSIKNIWFGTNYSTTAEYTENGTDIDYVAPQVSSNAEWTGDAKRIVEESGIEKQYQDRFDFELQTIRMPKQIEIGAGEKELLLYTGISSKNSQVDLSKYEITAKSSNPAVATADADYVTGHTAGTAWITFEILKREDGKVYYDEYTFCVIVE